MASPLAPYINSRLLVPFLGEVSLVNGRWSESAGDSYLVRMFIKRAQYSGVSSGSRNVPLASQLDGEMLPGASGDQFYYRGYALEWATVPSHPQRAANWRDGHFSQAIHTRNVCFYISVAAVSRTLQILTRTL